MLKFAALILIMQLAGTSSTGTMQRADKLTDQEKKELLDARAKVEAAQHDLRVVQAKIAAQHQMGQSDWMEYSTWYEFDGDFIVERYQSHRPLTNYAY